MFTPVQPNQDERVEKIETSNMDIISYRTHTQPFIYIHTEWVVASLSPYKYSIIRCHKSNPMVI